MIQSNIFAQKLLGPTVYTPKALIKYVGRTPAALLQQLHYSLQGSKFTQYGEVWVSRTLEQWAEILECSAKTIQRAFDRLTAFGLVISDRFHRHQYNQGKSYRVDYEALQTLLAEEPKRPDLLSQSVLNDVDTLTSSINNKSLNKEFKKQQTDQAVNLITESKPTHHPVLKINKGGNIVNPVHDCKKLDKDSSEFAPIFEESLNNEIEPELEQEIVETVGHKLSAGLKMLVINASQEVIQDALTIIQTSKNIKNKAGLLRRALEQEWKPSATAAEKAKFRLDSDFNEWWDYAKQLGLVIGSEMKGNQFWIYAAPNGEPKPYEEMRSMFSIGWLEKRIGKTDG